MKTTPARSCSALLGLLAAFPSCGERAAGGAAAQAAAAAAPAPGTAAARAGQAAPAPLAPFRQELLALAFDAASAFPVDPHGKNRSRAQEQVVVACFELEQPELALSFANRIEDWRRGCAYADFAWAMAKRGDAAKAREYVALANGVVEAERANPDAQDWRGDLIALKVARVHATLGDDAAAAQAAAAIDASSAHAVDGPWAVTASARMQKLTRDEASAELAMLATGFQTLTLGQQNVALAGVATLHGRFFADAQLRARAEELVGEAWRKVAPALRLEALATMVRNAVGAGDRPGAKALLATMRTILEGHAWRPEDRMPEAARVIELAFAAGDVDRARAEAEAALVDFHRQRDAIVNIYRAETLRPLALAWFTLGERQRALELLALVFEEGLENPNSRPRCDDFVATCVAMAVRGVEPSPAMWVRLREIRGGLGAPW
jgi:hypothetical protein